MSGTGRKMGRVPKKWARGVGTKEKRGIGGCGEHGNESQG